MATPFTVLTAPAVALDRANVDTDQIIPARFLKQPRSVGYGQFLFRDLRAGADGFPLDAPAAAGAAILVAARNFGCGSSREGAVYALVDGGIRCVIAPSFGDIFASNAAKNGLLTIVLEEARIAALLARLGTAPGSMMTVDLPAQRLTDPDGGSCDFAIDPFRKRCMVEGLDDVALTLEYAEAIAAYDRRIAAAESWRLPQPG